MISLPATLEALLFASGEALSRKRLCALLEVSPEMLEAALCELREELSHRGLSVVETDTELELRTNAEASPIVMKLTESNQSRDIGKASLETLSIVLYRNGATRSEIDHIRGVNSSTAIRTLLMRGLIEKAENDTDKRRTRYTGTIDALAHLGVKTVAELPNFSEFSKSLSERAEREEFSPTSK
jgi:segregation and condensation protein B